MLDSELHIRSLTILYSHGGIHYPATHRAFRVSVLSYGKQLEIERPFGKPDEGDGDHRQGSAGED